MMVKKGAPLRSFSKRLIILSGPGLTLRREAIPLPVPVTILQRHQDGPAYRKTLSTKVIIQCTPRAQTRNNCAEIQIHNVSNRPKSAITHRLCGPKQRRSDAGMSIMGAKCWSAITALVETFESSSVQ